MQRAIFSICLLDEKHIKDQPCIMSKCVIDPSVCKPRHLPNNNLGVQAAHGSDKPIDKMTSHLNMNNLCLSTVRCECILMGNLK